VLPSPDIDSIPHPEADCNRQNAQITGFLFLDLCAHFLLTKMPGYGIMVNSARYVRARGAEISNKKARD